MACACDANPSSLWHDSIGLTLHVLGGRLCPIQTVFTLTYSGPNSFKLVRNLLSCFQRFFEPLR